MSNPLFNEVPANQQETVAGGFSFNFTATNFLGEQFVSESNSASNPTGSVAIGGNAFTLVNTAGSNLTGLDAPADLDIAALLAAFGF